MKLNFLCEHHRRWMEEDPARAVNTWLAAYDRATELTEDGRYPEAIPYAGSAMEAAGIALRAWVNPDARAIRRYTGTGVLLTQLLACCSEERIARAVVNEAVAVLERLLLQGVERRSVLQGCEALLRAGDDIAVREPTQSVRRDNVMPMQSRQLH